MMSILLLTLLSWLHSHPVMSKVSLLPVANVVSSPVQNLVDVLVSEQAPGFAPDWKSRVKVALVNGPVELITELLVTVSFPPALATLKMSAQSFWLELQNDPPAQLVAVLPSSWKSSSWTASAFEIAKIPMATIAISRTTVSRRPRFPKLGMNL